MIFQRIALSNKFIPSLTYHPPHEQTLTSTDNAIIPARNIAANTKASGITARYRPSRPYHGHRCDPHRWDYELTTHPTPPAQPTSTQPASMHASIQPTSAQALRTTSADAVRNARTPEAPTRPTPTQPPTRPASTQASVHPASTHASIQPTPTAPSLHPLSSAAVPGPEGRDSG